MAKGAARRDPETFEDIMTLTAEDVKEPGLYPDGPWVLRNKGFNIADTKDRDGNDQKVITFRYEGFEPGPEVDPEEVEKGGFEGRTIWVRRYLSLPAAKAKLDGTLARLINFIAMHGVDPSGRNIEEMLKAVKGYRIAATLGRRAYTNRDGDTVAENTASDFAHAD